MFARLERSAVKVARCVLRGRDGGNTVLLLGEIPKPGSREKRKLGIPCVLDRLIQHAVLQVLQPRWDATFSEFSYGFRPGRSAHHAVAQAQAYLQQG